MTRAIWLPVILLASCDAPANPPDPNAVVYWASEDNDGGTTRDYKFPLPAVAECFSEVRRAGQLQFRLADRVSPPPPSELRPYRSSSQSPGTAPPPRKGGGLLAEISIAVEAGSPVRFRWHCTRTEKQPDLVQVRLRVQQANRYLEVIKPVPAGSLTATIDAGASYSAPHYSKSVFMAGRPKRLYIFRWTPPGHSAMLGDEAGFPQEVDFGQGLVPISAAPQPIWILGVEFTPDP